MFADDELLMSVLIGESKQIRSLSSATDMRHAIRFRYPSIPREFMMAKNGVTSTPHEELLARSSEDKTDAGYLQQQKAFAELQQALERPAEGTPLLPKEPSKLSQLRHLQDDVKFVSDSQPAVCNRLEFQLCVGFAHKKIMIPHRDQLVSMGRRLAVLKIHLNKKFCDLWFMSLADVERTYKDTVPKNVELVKLYRPNSEGVFWADLMDVPSNVPRGYSRNIERCIGSYGSRFTLGGIADILGDLVDPKEGSIDLKKGKAVMQKMVEMTENLTQAEIDANVARNESKSKKTAKKKEKRKKKKEEDRTLQEEERQREQAQLEAEKMAELKASRIPAPHLQQMDFKGLMAGNLPEDDGNAENRVDDDESATESDSS